MVDWLDKKTRSKIMSCIRSKNTKPELILKKYLKGSHPKCIIGNPDFANKEKKIAIFVDGCFWHKCPKCYRAPKSNKRYWLPKINRNVERSKEVTRTLKKDGWKVIRIWEHDIKLNIKNVKK